MNVFRGGNAGGFTSFLRRRFGDAVYAGNELEVNQKHVRARHVGWAAMRTNIAGAR